MGNRDIVHEETKHPRVQPGRDRWITQTIQRLLRKSQNTMLIT